MEVSAAHRCKLTTGAEEFRQIWSTRAGAQEERAQEQHLRGSWKKNHQQGTARESRTM